MLKIFALFALLGALFTPDSTAPVLEHLAVEPTPSLLTSAATSGTISGTVVNPVQLQIQLNAPNCPVMGNFTLLLFPGAVYGTIIGVGSSYLGIPQIIRGYYRESGGAASAIVAAAYSNTANSPYHTMELRWTTAGYLDGGWRERP